MVPFISQIAFTPEEMSRVVNRQVPTPFRGPDEPVRAMIEEFALAEDRKEWLRNLWQQAVEQQFARLRSEDVYTSDLSGVLVVQGLLLDVVSRIPLEASESSYTLVSDPWSATVVLELRDAATGDLLARTVDRRNATGLLETGAVWYRTPDLIERWAQVLVERLEQLSEIGGRPRRWVSQ